MLKSNTYFFKYLMKNNREYFVVSVLINIIRGASLAFANVLFLKWLFDCIESGDTFAHALSIICIYAVYQIVVTFLYIWLWNYYTPIQKEKLKGSMMKEIYNKCKNVELEKLDNPEYYETYKWCLDGITELSTNVINCWCDLLSHVASITVICIVLVEVDWRFIVVNCISFVLVDYFNRKSSKSEMERVKELKPHIRKNDYVNRIFYIREFAYDIRLSDVKKIFFDKFHNTNKEMVNVQHKYSKIITFLEIVRDFIMIIINFVVLIFYLVYKYLVLGTITLGSVTAVLNSIWRFSSDLSGIMKCYKNFSVFSLYIDRYRNFIEEDIETFTLVDKVKLIDGIHSVEFQDVCFKYHGAEENVINHINFKLNKKCKVAIVGKNGNGKSTLIKLLTRLYKPDSGRILINDMDINDIDLSSFRETTGCVFQNYQIYAASIAENVKMDFVEEDDLGQIRKALSSCNLDEKISQLKKKENSNLTKEYDENGINLSGGQEQRVAISRVFYKSNSLVILDEPTSALDPNAEYKLYSEIGERLKDKIVVMITHRLSAVKDADLILYIKDGQVYEEGTHEELMKLKGEYAEVFNIQASKYKLSAFN